MSRVSGRVRARGAWAIAIIATAIAWQASPAFGADSVYWTNYSGGQVRVGPLAGGTPANLFSDGTNLGGIAIDPAAGKIYWTDYFAGAIRVGNLDGSGTPTNLFTGENSPLGLAVDPAAGKIYWTSYSGNAIRVGNLDGSGTPTSLFTGEPSPGALAIDPAAGKVYWSDFSSGAIRVGSLSGGTGSNLFTGESGPSGVAIDKAAGKIYWVNYTSGAIRVANLDGSGASNLFTGENSSWGAALDPPADKVYWAGYQNAAHAIRVGSFGGGTASSLFAGEGSPIFAAILRSPSGTGAPQISGGSSVASTLSCSKGSWADDLEGAFLYRAPQSFSYQWRLNGSNIAGATDNTYTVSQSGSYTCQVTATNQAGSDTQTSAAHGVPPNTKITKAKISQRKNKATFRFKALEGPANGFECKLKRAHHRKPKAKFRSCHSPKTYKHLKPGKYTFKVRAFGPGGTDPTPAKRKFRIKP